MSFILQLRNRNQDIKTTQILKSYDCIVNFFKPILLKLLAFNYCVDIQRRFVKMSLIYKDTNDKYLHCGRLSGQLLQRYIEIRL